MHYITFVVPCDMLNLATCIPASNNLIIVSASHVAGLYFYLNFKDLFPSPDTLKFDCVFQ